MTRRRRRISRWHPLPLIIILPRPPSHRLSHYREWAAMGSAITTTVSADASAKGWVVDVVVVLVIPSLWAHRTLRYIRSHHVIFTKLMVSAEPCATHLKLSYFNAIDVDAKCGCLTIIEKKYCRKTLRRCERPKYPAVSHGSTML